MKMLAPRLKLADLSVAPMPPREVDPFYRSAEWEALKAAVRRRSGGVCEVVIEGRRCTRPAKVCDHIVRRKAGGADVVENLRDMCREHDNQVKEDSLGQRRSGGQLS